MGGPWRTLQFFQIIFRTMSFRVQHDEGRRQAFLDHIAAGISWIPRQRTTAQRCATALPAGILAAFTGAGLLEARVKSLRALLKPA